MPNDKLVDIAPRIGKYVRALKLTRPRNRLTDVYHLFGENEGYLGNVEWYTAWRCYGFFPADNSVYEPTCLRDIATFCEKLTQERKAERKAEKDARV